MKTRCKFYVTAVNTTHAGPNGSSHTQVTLAAVYSPDPDNPNKVWWDASPNGSMKLNGPAEQMSQFVAGEAWYIDTQNIPLPVPLVTELTEEEQKERWDEARKDPNIWRLCLLGQPYSEQLQVKLTPIANNRWNDYLEVTINNKSAWGSFRNLNDHYRLEMIKAE